MDDRVCPSVERSSRAAEAGEECVYLSDQDVVLMAMKSAAKILSEYLEASRQDPAATAGQLIDVFDNQNLAEAIMRMDRL